MFKLLRKTADLAVDVAGGITKGAIKVTTTVGTAVVAESIRLATGKNEVADFMWNVQEKTSKATDFVVDKAAKPLAKAVAKAPIRKTEWGYEIGKGATKAIFTDNKEEGMKELKKASFMLCASVVTGGILGVVAEVLEDVAGEQVEDMVAGIFSDTAESHVSDTVSFGEPRFGGSGLIFSESNLSPVNEVNFLENIKSLAASNGEESLINMIDSYAGSQNQLEKITEVACQHFGEDNVRMLSVRFGKD